MIWGETGLTALSSRGPLHDRSVDGAIALAVLVGSLVFGAVGRAGADFVVLSVLLAAPLVVRRRWPAVCVVAVCGVALVQWLTVRSGIAAHPADVAVPIAVHAAAAYGRAWVRWFGVTAGLGGAVLGGTSWPLLATSVRSHVLMGAFLASTVVAAWTIGALQRVRRAQVEAVAERARLLEVEREQRDRLAVLAERRRIARDMHDVVAHALAGVIAQADGARYADSPETGTAALEAIGQHARRALAETRRVLGLLREESVGPVPAPGVADLPALVQVARDAGLDVRLTLDGAAGSVEPGLSLVVYRIVQEGLTNVMKHAEGSRAEVAVTRSALGVTVEVRDEGRAGGAAAVGGGYGLMGMRERASAYGGTVSLDARPGGGHVLRAELPVPR
jgi:signal transduction histidine kinase